MLRKDYLVLFYHGKAYVQSLFFFSPWVSAYARSVFLQVRGLVNQKLEEARSNKLIGASLEAKVYLHASSADLQQKLISMCGSNDVDHLKRIFLVSQVSISSPHIHVCYDSSLHVICNFIQGLTYCMSFWQVEVLSSREETDVPFSSETTLEEGESLWVGVARADGAKCERCWNYSPAVGTLEGHPGLCERCYEVIDSYPSAQKTPVAV